MLTDWSLEEGLQVWIWNDSGRVADTKLLPGKCAHLSFPVHMGNGDEISAFSFVSLAHNIRHRVDGNCPGGVSCSWITSLLFLVMYAGVCHGSPWWLTWLLHIAVVWVIGEFWAPRIVAHVCCCSLVNAIHDEGDGVMILCEWPSQDYDCTNSCCVCFGLTWTDTTVTW